MIIFLSTNFGEYSKNWHDPAYFDDLFDSLIPQLMVSGNWSLFKTLFENIDGYASNETTAKVAYIYGRLIQEGYIKVKDKDLEIERAFTRALDCGINPYYKILSAYRLGYSGDEFTRVLCSSPAPSDKQRVESAEILLKGYVYFGFPEKVYPEWLELFKLGISTDTSMQMAQFLSVCAKYDSDYYPLSLRIAARSANISDRSLTTEELKFVYPQDYSEIIDTYSSKYNLDNSIMYALVRSESFFDEDVRSTAGAVGLTQLMELTAEDIAGKLKKREYNLIDPETNVEFGTYYLSELIRRCDNSILQAFFSYNAGIIYDQVGECVIYVNNSRFEIDENSADTLSTITITQKDHGTGDYYISLQTTSGKVISSFKVIVKEPLNAWAIVIIVVAVAAVGTVVITIIVLRNKMRIR